MIDACVVPSRLSWPASVCPVSTWFFPPFPCSLYILSHDTVCSKLFCFPFYVFTTFFAHQDECPFMMMSTTLLFVSVRHSPSWPLRFDTVCPKMCACCFSFPLLSSPSCRTKMNRTELDDLMIDAWRLTWSAPCVLVPYISSSVPCSLHIPPFDTVCSTLCVSSFFLRRHQDEIP